MGLQLRILRFETWYPYYWAHWANLLQQECVECLGLVDVINDLSIPDYQHNIHKPDQMKSSYNLKKGRNVVIWKNDGSDKDGEFKTPYFLYA